MPATYDPLATDLVFEASNPLTAALPLRDAQLAYGRSAQLTIGLRLLAEALVSGVPGLAYGQATQVLMANLAKRIQWAYNAFGVSGGAGRRKMLGAAVIAPLQYSAASEWEA